MKDLSPLFPSELRILNVLWEQGDLTAAQLATHFKASIGWNRNTTYTVIKKCVSKGFIQRTEPRFHCHALITRRQVQRHAVQTLAKTLYGGDFMMLSADAAEANGV